MQRSASSCNPTKLEPYMLHISAETFTNHILKRVTNYLDYIKQMLIEYLPWGKQH